jgi:hypothetical protein
MDRIDGNPQLIAIGVNALTTRIAVMMPPYRGFVCHTIRRNGGMYLKATSRSRSGGRGSPFRSRGW